MKKKKKNLLKKFTYKSPSLSPTPFIHIHSHFSMADASTAGSIKIFCEDFKIFFHELLLFF